jgi:hypothetical protein
MWTNDINQGRPKAKGVPQSDQWDDDLVMPRISRRNQEPIYHKKQVMSGNNGPGVYRQIQDELFLSKQCKRDATTGDSLYPNPHDGRMENERFCFHFPATWYYTHTVNKSIGLRRIQIVPRWYSFVLDFTCTIGGLATHHRVKLTITPESNIGQVLSLMCQGLNRRLNPAVPLPFEVSWSYSENREAHLIFTAGAGVVMTTALDVGASQNLDAFFDMMNVPQAKRADYIVVLVGRTDWQFDNVWNRLVNSVYFHASFVNHTQMNYLGQSGDFYPKPSKLYLSDNLPMDFYFWITSDGMTPLALPFEHFLVELAFIIDSQDYQSQ